MLDYTCAMQKSGHSVELTTELLIRDLFQRNPIGAKVIGFC
jgi:hypothetical protein